MQWYYAVNGQQQGPVEQDELFSLARDGKIRRDDLVWNSDMGSQWAKASTIPGLFGVMEPSSPGMPPPVSEWSSEARFKGRTHNRDLMAGARDALSGNWGLAVAGVLVYCGLVLLMAVVPYLGSLVSFIISGPLVVGWSLFFLTLSRRQSASVGQIFDGFKVFATAFLAYLLTALLVFAWALPGIVVIIVGLFTGLKKAIGGGMPPASFGVIAGWVVLAMLAMIPAIIAQYRYSMTYFVINDTAGIGPMEAIRHSTQMMRGNKWKFFCLQCRFIGWSLLCLLTLGIGFLWLMPYMMTSMAAFYDDVRNGQASS